MQGVSRVSPVRLASGWGDLAAVLALATGVRALAHAAGVRFDFEVVTWYMQFLDLAELARNLFASLLRLHSQPPLLNALAGLLLKLFGRGAGAAAGLLFGAAGILADAALFLLVRRLTGSRAAAWAVCVATLANPAYLVYENYFFYTPLVQAGLVAAAFALERLAATRRLRWYAAYGLALAAVAWTRSLYHPLLVIAALALPVAVLRPAPRAMAWTGLAAAALVLCWPAKNLLLFGRFTSSSWMGMNLYNTVYQQSYTPDELRRFYRYEALPWRTPAGADGPVGRIKPFGEPETYLALFPVGRTGFAVLDAPRRRNGQVNYNHAVYLPASDAYLAEYRKVVRRDPRILASVLRSSAGYFLQPATEHDVIGISPVSRRNLEALAAADRWYRTVCYWPVAQGHGRSLACTLAAATAAVVLLLPWRVARRAAGWRDPSLLAPAFLWLVVSYVTLAGNLFENYENMRFRFEIEPLLLAGCACLATPLVAARAKAAPEAAG